MKGLNKNRRGIFLSIVAAFISGLAIFYNKLVITSGADPLVFNIIKNGGCAFILSLLLLNGNFGTVKKKLSGKIFPKLILLGVVGGSLPFVIYFNALGKVPAVNAAIIHKTLFIWVVLLAIPFLKERLTGGQIAGYLLVVAANFFISGFSGFLFSPAEAMILLATFFWAIEVIIVKKTLKLSDNLTVAWGRMFFGVMILLVVSLISGKGSLILPALKQQIIPLTGSIILLTLYVISFYQALQLTPATAVTAVLVLSTPITNFLSAGFITGSWPAALILNSGMLILGVSLVTMYSSRIDSHVSYVGKG